MIKNTKPQFLALLAGLSLTGFAANQASATIIAGGVTTGTGSFIILPVPFTDSTPDNTVGNDTFQNLNLYGFDEDQNVLVAGSPLSVDYKPGGGPGTIAVGTEVASHYIFFDPLGTARQVGYVDFDSPILGVLSSTGNLLSSDYLANTGVNYLNPTLRGLEAGDSAIIDPSNPNRLLVDWTASSPGDYVRVLTQHSPGAVPDTGSTLVLMGLTLGVLERMRRRWKK